MAHFIGLLLVLVIVVVVFVVFVVEGHTLSHMLTGLKMSYRFINLCELLSLLVYRKSLLLPFGQVINVSKFLQIARFVGASV